MREYITGVIKANEIYMDLSVLRMRNPFFSCLLVEGSSDCLFYSKFIDNRVCKITSALGKQNVIDAVHLLENRNCSGILGIIDADFWHIQKKQAGNNVLMTDGHDLETTILFQSDVLEKILLEYGSAEKIKQFIEKIHRTIQDQLILSTSHMGLFRLVNEEKNFNLNFKHILAQEFKKFLDLDTLRLNLSKFISFILKRSEQFELIKETHRLCTGETLDRNYFQNQILQYQQTYRDHFQICRGHDFSEILFIGLSEVFGREGPDLPSNRKILESGMRIGYQVSDFLTTVLYSSIKEWEKKNSSYKILTE